MNPKFSIIIPVYNVAPYLCECLDSVLAQTFTCWEAICIDDGSTDGSGAILDEYAAKDSRFRVIHQANAGVSAARNTALGLLHGEWVLFLDGDDMFHKDSLNVIREYTVTYSTIDIIKFANYLGDRVPASWGKNDEIASKVLMVDDESRMLHGLEGACMYALRRVKIGMQKFERYRWLEDVIFIIRYLGNCRDMLLTNDILYFYRRREGSAIHSKHTREQVNEIFRATDKLIDESFIALKSVRAHDFNRYWKSLHAFAYFAFGRSYFDLSADDRTLLLDSWLRLQNRFDGVYRMPLEWRVRIKLAKLIHSGLLVKPIVLVGCQWRIFASKFVFVLKGLLR